MSTRDHHDDRLETDVVVIGAGLAGLTAAAVAAEQPATRVTVLDAHPAGGQARTDERNGFVFNRGPRALYVGGAGRPILESLGVDTSKGGAPATKGGMGRVGGQAQLLPQDLVSGIKSPLVGFRDLAQLGPLLSQMSKLVDSAEPGQSLQDWIASRGLRPTVAALVHMLARVATYTNAPDVVDARAVLTNMALALTDGVRYLDGGFQTLVDGLLATCEQRGVTVVSGDGARVEHVEALADDRVVVDLGDRWITARSAVLAVGGPDQAIRLLGSTPAAWTRLGPSPTAACLELGVRRLPRHRVVFGVDEPTYLSTHCPPADLAPPGHAVVHVMRYQPVDDTMPADEQRALLRDVAASAGIDAADIVEERFLARMVVTGPLPTATGGGLAGRPPVDVADHPGVLVAGDWVGPTGLLSDGAVASGAEAGRLAADRANQDGGHMRAWADRPRSHESVRARSGATSSSEAERADGQGPGRCVPARPLSGSTSSTLPPADDPEFTRERPRLLGVAYRITGSRADAEDVVQDAWFRWQRTDRATIERPEAWLTTVTSRIALDRLKSAQRTREEYVGPWLPEMANTEPGPADHAEMAESLTVGFLTVLERLGPIERVVFLLADVFAHPFDEIATVVDKTPEACRQIASRARRRVQEDRPKFEPTDDVAWEVATAFISAAQAGELDHLLEMLSEGAVLVSDGGADHHAARRPIVRERIPRFVSNIVQRREARLGPNAEVVPEEINGQPGVVIRQDGQPTYAVAFAVSDAKVDRIWIMVNPDKLARLDDPPVA